MRRFTVEEYHRMIEAGVFAADERFELLEGWIVAEITRTPPHDVAIELLTDALRGALPAGWWVRVQSAITLTDSEPEPDLAVVRGAVRDHVQRHPDAAEIAVVIEVADSSLAPDRDLKGRVPLQRSQQRPGVRPGRDHGKIVGHAGQNGARTGARAPFC